MFLLRKFTFAHNTMAEVKFLLLINLISLFLISFVALEEAEDASEKWKKKDIRDYTDADVERLYEQWEVGHVTTEIYCTVLYCTVL